MLAKIWGKQKVKKKKACLIYVSGHKLEHCVRVCVCVQQQTMYEQQPCGAEFLPSPLVTTAEYALSTNPVYTRKSMLTSVAVSVVNNNTVAFVGTNLGEVLKVMFFSSYLVEQIRKLLRSLYANLNSD